MAHPPSGVIWYQQVAEPIKASNCKAPGNGDTEGTTIMLTCPLSHDLGVHLTYWPYIFQLRRDEDKQTWILKHRETHGYSNSLLLQSD